MAFKIALTPTYRNKVEVETPNGLGTFDKSDFMAEFKRVGYERINELERMVPLDVLQEVLVGWTDLLDESGNQIPFSQEAKKILLDIVPARLALVEAFWGGLSKAKEKN